MAENLVIALDGPAAAGKGTLARRLAESYNLAYLDSGTLYRGVGLAVLRQGLDPTNESAATAAAVGLRPEILAEPEIRVESTSQAASKVAAIPAVRAALLDWQRHFAARPPAGKAGAVLDGRDIGTVIAPEAPAKLYVTATPEVRAERRRRQLEAQGEAVPFEEVLADILKRDARDGGRETAPMAAAKDAILLDTSEMTIDRAFDAARRIVEAARARWEKS